MIESYQIEIMKKHRAARLFWLIVFVFAFFLYFFFQGYYPDVRLGMRRIFSESGTLGNSGSSDLIRSFGIINVRAIPTDSTITLDSGSYSNNDKRISDYGKYSMQIENSGYLPNTMQFILDREKPFFIEKVSLIPRPIYQKLKSVTEVYQITEDEYIFKTASGLVWSGSTASGKVNYKESLQYIGGRYFKSATGVLIWGVEKFEKTNASIANFVQTCKKAQVIYGLLYCSRSQSILTG